MDYASFILNGESKEEDDLVSYPDFATSVYDSGAETLADSASPILPPVEVTVTPFAALERSHFKLSHDVSTHRNSC